MIAALLLISSALAEDIPLDYTTPIAEDPFLHVISLYRNQPVAPFYYSVIYHCYGHDLKRHFTKISFSIALAGNVHYEMERWARRSFDKYRSKQAAIPLETQVIVRDMPNLCGIVQMEEEDAQNQEIYMIPGRKST